MLTVTMTEEGAYAVRCGRFTFECRLDCDTKEPKIEWFKEGREVPRDRQLYRDGLCQLVIDVTGPDDTAKYTCRATTEAGTTDTSASLRVKGSSKIHSFRSL